MQGLIQQVKVENLRGNTLSDSSTYYQRQVSSCVYNSYGVNELNCNYLAHEMKATINYLLYKEILANADGLDNDPLNYINFSIPITTNLLESANLLQTHLFGLGGGLRIEIYLASDNSFLQLVNYADPSVSGNDPTFELTECRLHYNVLRFDPSTITNTMKQILYESTETITDNIQSNDETRQVPLVSSACQSLLIDAVKSQNVNNYFADSNNQETFGLNTERVLINGMSLPIQQELTYPQENQVIRTGITPVQREALKGVSHDATLQNVRSCSSQTTYDSTFKALGETSINGFYAVEVPFARRSCYGVLFGREGSAMKFGNLTFRFIDTASFADSYDNTTGTPDLPQPPQTNSPYTLYKHITSLKVLQVDESSGLVSVRQ